MLLHFVVLSTEDSECLIGGNALPVVCGTMPFLKAVPWPLVISLFAVTQAVLALCHVRRNTQADFVPCGPLHSGPAAEYCLVGEVTTNGVLLAGACFGSVPQGTIAVGTVPWAAHPEEAKDSYTTYSWCESYLQTERTLFELTGKINFGREHHAHCGCKHKLGHPHMQGMFLLLWFLLTCGPSDK